MALILISQWYFTMNTFKGISQWCLRINPNGYFCSKNLLRRFFLYKLPLFERTVEYNWNFCKSFYQWILLFIAIPQKGCSKYFKKKSKKHLLQTKLLFTVKVLLTDVLHRTFLKFSGMPFSKARLNVCFWEK